MATVKGVLLSAEKKIYEGKRDIWNSNNGLLYAWIVTIKIEGVEKTGKAFSKNEDSYPIPINTEVVFTTDWVEKYGYCYFKGIKDAEKASKYNTQSNNTSTNQTKNVSTPFDKEALIKKTLSILTLKYIVHIESQGTDIKDLTLPHISQYIDFFKQSLFSTINDYQKTIDAIELTILLFDIKTVKAFSINSKTDLINLVNFFKGKDVQTTPNIQ